MITNAHLYQPGGVAYQNAAARFGTAAANQLANAALTQSQEDFNFTLSNIRSGTTGGALETSTLRLFGNYITTDPLTAPLSAINKPLGNTLLGVIRNPWVFIALALALFFWLGGADFLRRKMRKA